MPHPYGNWVAFALYVIAGISDYLDGWLARKYSMTSIVGKVLDPIADKLLITAVILMLMAVHIIDGYFTIAGGIIICRELLVSGLREFLLQIGGTGIAVSRLAKWKTAGQIGSLGWLLVGTSVTITLTNAFTLTCIHIGLGILVIAAILTIITGWNYMLLGYTTIKEKNNPRG